MFLCYLFCDRPAPARAFRLRTGHAIKALRQACVLTHGHAGAIIFDFDISAHLPLIANVFTTAQGDLAAGGRVFDGIVQKIAD